MLKRRLLTVPGYLLAWLAWLATAPLWLPIAAGVDLLRRSRGVALRSAAMVSVYLSCEAIGIVLSGGLWLWRGVRRPSDEQWTDLHFRLETWWGTTLFRAAVRSFGLRVEIDDQADLADGPYLLLPRHASTGDTLIASALVSRPYGTRLRYVLKRELLWDPCLDIVGNRLPNVFLDRFSEDSAREIARIQEIARDLGARDGVLIYPEGTRFSEPKRLRVLERLRERGDDDLVGYAESLRAVLPPRPGGTLGLLEAAPDADVVFCAHTGFEAAASLAEIWRGDLLNQVIRVRFRRVARARVPTERAAREAWLRNEWRGIDAWVMQNRAPAD